MNLGHNDAYETTSEMDSILLLTHIVYVRVVLSGVDLYILWSQPCDNEDGLEYSSGS